MRSREPGTGGTLSTPDAFVDKTPQERKETGKALELIEDRQPARLSAQEQLGIRELVAVRVPLEIEVDRRARPGDLQGQRRLAHLARSEQGNDRKGIQAAAKSGAESSRNHCKIELRLKICNEERDGRDGQGLPKHPELCLYRVLQQGSGSHLSGVRWIFRNWISAPSDCSPIGPESSAQFQASLRTWPLTRSETQPPSTMIS